MKQHLFLDTNILLDFIVGVPDLYNNAAKIISLADIGSVKITISVISYATTFYVAHIRYNMPEKDILEKLRKFKILSNVVSTNHNTVVEKALNSTFKDFEDAL